VGPQCLLTAPLSPAFQGGKKTNRLHRVRLGEAKRYEGRLQKGGILVSVHCDTSAQIKRAKEIMERTGAEDISSAGEASADGKSSDTRSTKKVGMGH